MMEKFNRTILDVIGNTPIIKLQKIGQELKADFYVKLEFMNPGGSIKDRIGYYMCREAMKRGDLKPGGIIVEATSGNTGIGIAMFAAVHGCHAIFVMADKQSKEKIDILRAYGAEVVICPTAVEIADPRSYYSVSQKIAQEMPGCFYANQYSNPDNELTHYHTTGPEIFHQTQGDFDYLVAGVGTGGTISGISRYLKEKMPQVKVLGIDIKGSVVSHFHATGELITGSPYVVEGIGHAFIPENVKCEYIDEFQMVEDEESFVMARRLLKEEGIYCGGSCGSAVIGAIHHAQKTLQNTATKRKYLIILPDSGSRYLSKVYNDSWMKQLGYPVAPAQAGLRSSIQKCFGEGVKLI